MVLQRLFSLCSRPFTFTLRIRLTVFLVTLLLTPVSESAGQEGGAFLWRQIIPASSTTHTMFLSRSPQLIMFRDGLIIYTDDAFKAPYSKVALSKKEIGELYLYMQNTFGLPGLSIARLKREEPYIKSVQKPLKNDNTRVSIWVGLHAPPSLHTHTLSLLEARSGNTKLGPGWDALYNLNRFLSGFRHERAEPYIPDRVELSVQPLPSHRAGDSSRAVAWPFAEIDLAAVRGQSRQGFREVTGALAGRVYEFVFRQDVVRMGDAVYLVWARPLLAL